MMSKWGRYQVSVIALAVIVGCSTAESDIHSGVKSSIVESRSGTAAGVSAAVSNIGKSPQDGATTQAETRRQPEPCTGVTVRKIAEESANGSLPMWVAYFSNTSEEIYQVNFDLMTRDTAAYRKGALKKALGGLGNVETERRAVEIAGHTTLRVPLVEATVDAQVMGIRLISCAH